MAIKTALNNKKPMQRDDRTIKKTIRNFRNMVNFAKVFRIVRNRIVACVDVRMLTKWFGFKKYKNQQQTVKTLLN